MPSFAIITCRARSQASSVAKGGISFHRFPKDPDIREKWIDVTGREDWFPTKSSTICSKHFGQNDYTVKKSGNKYLKEGAVPHERVVYFHSSANYSRNSPSSSQKRTISKTDTREDQMIIKKAKVEVNYYTCLVVMLLKKVYTLVFVRNQSQLLLGLKKRGFGVNKWNGFGGKVEPNELIVDAASRELKEECCLDVNTSDLRNIGHLEFTFKGDPITMDVRVFSTTVFEGTPSETEEMLPKWFMCDQIPFDDMWPDDRLWFPWMLKGKLFYGSFHYEGFDKILSYNIQELESMEAFYAEKK